MADFSAYNREIKEGERWTFTLFCVILLISVPFEVEKIMDKKTWKEVIREELKKLSGLSWGERAEYIFTYYKLLFVVIAMVVIGIYIGVTVYHNLHQKDVVQVYLINSGTSAFSSEEVAARFEEYIGGLKADEVITIDDSISLKPNDMSEYGMAAQMKIVAATGSGGMDLLITDRETFESFQKQGYFMPLDQVFSKEELEQWTGRLAYREEPQPPVLETEDPYAVSTAIYTLEETAASYQEALPDGTESCYGVRVEDSIVLASNDAFSGSAAYAAVLANTTRLERSADFIRFLLTQEENTK